MTVQRVAYNRRIVECLLVDANKGKAICTREMQEVGAEIGVKRSTHDKRIIEARDGAVQKSKPTNNPPTALISIHWKLVFQ